MADLYPFAAGNWSTNSNWYNAATGATVNRQPTTGDNVWLNNKTIVVDTTITCDKLSNKAFTGAGFSPVAGGSATVALLNTYYPTITVGAGGIESNQAGASNTISVTGSSTTGTTSSFQILCSGDITGGTTSNIGSAINITCTNTQITITAKNIYGGLTDNRAAGIYISGNGNVIYINCSETITANAAAGVYVAATTGSVIYKATSINASTTAGILYRAASAASGTQYIGYTWSFVTKTETAAPITDITSSGSYPAIASIIQGAEGFNTVPLLIRTTNITGSSAGIFPISSPNYKLTVTNIKYYDTANTLIIYQNQTPSATTVTEASIWGYLTTNAEFSTTNAVAKLIKDNLNATVSSRLATSGYTAPDNSSITAIKAKTDNLPSDPASNTQVNTRLASASYTAPDNATISTINTNVSAIKTKTDNLPLNTATQLTTIQTATDRIPTNPASVQSTGDQIATLQ